MSTSEPVSIRILDREYLIACTLEERPGLLAAASHVDAKMREIRSNTRAAGLDRITVLAALNIAHELIALREAQARESEQLLRHVSLLQAKLEGAFPASVVQ